MPVSRDVLLAVPYHMNKQLVNERYETKSNSRKERRHRKDHGFVEQNRARKRHCRAECCATACEMGAHARNTDMKSDVV